MLSFIVFVENFFPTHGVKKLKDDFNPSASPRRGGANLRTWFSVACPEFIEEAANSFIFRHQ